MVSVLRNGVCSRASGVPMVGMVYANLQALFPNGERHRQVGKGEPRVGNDACGGARGGPDMGVGLLDVYFKCVTPLPAQIYAQGKFEVSCCQVGNGVVGIL